ncbi:nucleotidyltransferase domain-containing protein [Streptomyces antimicrobicus]|uniref:Nucleotidyltransferase domain-containing protein n=1 Tax=Streptomyces antimicrobicus TaxID=2883108 RepID=A0ABS8B267_9ACTN|nr:nucleotidyltransferase domain-containing protein [Streptomyces antimicrobicus]MCB5178707.1 nucleotidyltransferase domain-containing protein [Streptomyces antimicrobicus]
MVNEAGRGVDARGWIEREGSLGRVQPAYAELVATARARTAEAYGRRLHSAYLYGSVPRGTARPGRSDLDVLLALHAPPTEEDRQTAEALARGLDEDFAVVDGVGLLLYGKDRLLSEQERYDLGWFVACLCTPLLGADLAEHLPRYRPDSVLARETNGDLAEVLPRWRERTAAVAGGARGGAGAGGVAGGGAGGGADVGGAGADVVPDPGAVRRLRRAWARKLVRTAFTLVMPRWGGWTSDLERSAEIFGRYYPERSAQVRGAAADAQAPGSDPAVLRVYAEDLGPWLEAEYTRVHGRKGASAGGGEGEGEGLIVSA